MIYSFKWGELTMDFHTEETKEYVKVLFGDKALKFYIPNGACLWRAQTLKTKEPWTLEWINTFTEDDIFWDVGANVGVFTLYAAVMKGVKVFAFEPEAANYRVLNDNIRINNITNLVRAYCVGISDRHSLSELNLSIIETAASNHQLGLKANPAFIQGCVTFSLDNLCLHLPKPTKLKIDVDGIEPLIVQGGLEQCLPNVKNMLVETYSGNHPKRLNTLKIIKPLLEQHGFKWDEEFAEKTVYKSGRYEGMGEHLFTR